MLLLHRSRRFVFIWVIIQAGRKARPVLFGQKHRTFLKKVLFFCTFAHMKRQISITLALLLCAIRSFGGVEYGLENLLPDASIHSLQSPLSVCRYKNPFPFQCVQLVKKRLCNPPDCVQAGVFCLQSEFPPASPGVYPDLFDLLQSPATEPQTATIVFYCTGHWHSCGIERNVFHPPPAPVSPGAVSIF